MARLRAGRVKGFARPMITGRGSGSLPARRRAQRPRPVAGVRPAATASMVRSRPARSARAQAEAVTRARTAAVTAASIQTGMVRDPVP